MRPHKSREPDTAARAEPDPVPVGAPGRSETPPGTPAGAALDENVETIKAWEHQALLARSPAERIVDRVVNAAASGPSLWLHVALFSMWMAYNGEWIPGAEPFDRFPFPLLTIGASLEAIFLSLFVLSSQSRLTKQSEKRRHLDLQINLLAEREMTAVLHVLQDISRHLGVEPTVTSEQLRELSTKTDIGTLTDRVSELGEETQPSTSPLA